MKNVYFDTNGEEINNGDILRLKNYTQSKSEFAPKEPYLIFIQNDDNCELYISGMDEFQPVEDWQTDEDKKENKISAVEIFAPIKSYSANFLSKQDFISDELIKMQEKQIKILERENGQLRKNFDIIARALQNSENKRCYVEIDDLEELVSVFRKAIIEYKNTDDEIVKCLLKTIIKTDQKEKLNQMAKISQELGLYKEEIDA